MVLLFFLQKSLSCKMCEVGFKNGKGDLLKA